MPAPIEREPDGNLGLGAFLRLPESFGDLRRERIAMFCERLNQLPATSWAIPIVSAIIRAFAINPWRSSLVAT